MKPEWTGIQDPRDHYSQITQLFAPWAQNFSADLEYIGKPLFCDPLQFDAVLPNNQ